MAKRTCSINDCKRPHRSNGWCRLHYDRWRRTGDPLGRYRQSDACAVDGCERAPNARGWCVTHYARWKRHGDPLGRKQRQQRRCSVEGCEAKHFGRDLCRQHYQRWAQHGDPLGGRALNGQADFYTQGYHCITVNGRVVREHRYVMEQILGRSLLPNETPHHKNGHRADNRPENLELWVHGQPPGQRAKDLLAWAEEIVARYGPERDKL